MLVLLATEMYADLTVRAASAHNLREHFIFVGVDVWGSRFSDRVSSIQEPFNYSKHSQTIQSLAVGSFLITPAAKTPKDFVQYLSNLQSSEDKHFYNSLEPNWYEEVAATLREHSLHDWELSSAVFVRFISK